MKLKKIKSAKVKIFKTAYGVLPLRLALKLGRNFAAQNQKGN